MTRSAPPLISAGVAAGAIAAGAVGAHASSGAAHEHDLERRPLGAAARGPRHGRRPSTARRSPCARPGRPEAPVLLFVHGFSLDMTTWYEQWMDLSADFRCVVMDQRGHGRSGPPRTATCRCARWAATWRRCSIASRRTAPAVRRGSSMGAMADRSRWLSSGPSCSARGWRASCWSAPRPRDLLRGRDGLGHRAAAAPAGLLRAAAQRVDRLRKAVLASPADLRGRGRAPHPVRARRSRARGRPRRAPRASARPRTCGPTGSPS